MSAKTYLTIIEAAEVLTVKKRTVYNLIERGALPAYRFGAATRIRKVDLDKFIANSKVKRLGRPLKVFNQN